MISIQQDLKDFRLHDRIGFQFSVASKMWDAELDAALAKEDMSRLKWCVLTGIEIEKQLSPSDLADHIGISRSAVSRVLKVMEKSLLIERNLLGGDGRTRMLNVTDIGREKLKLCWEPIREQEQRFLNRLTAQQQGELSAILQTLYTSGRIKLDTF